MKRTAKIIAMTILLSAGTWVASPGVQANMSISFQFFYDNLSPYGRWVDSPHFGYVWIPDADPGFYPYQTAGYWVYSDYGWTWVSDYSWGWAPFHYGRWYFDDWYGWAWVPGAEWGPGWVTWSRCDGYYGWAPLSPGFTFAMQTGWRFHIPAHEWVFLPDRYFGRRDIDRHYVNRHDNDRLYRHATIIEKTGQDRETHVRYFSGPETREVHRVTGREFKPVEVREENRPGQRVDGKRLDIYRPRVERTNSQERQRMEPKRYEAYGDHSRKASPAPVKGGQSTYENQAKRQSSTRQDPGNVREKPAPQQSKTRKSSSERGNVNHQNSKAPDERASVNNQKTKTSPERDNVNHQGSDGRSQNNKNSEEKRHR